MIAPLSVVPPNLLARRSVAGVLVLVALGGGCSSSGDETPPPGASPTGGGASTGQGGEGAASTGGNGSGNGGSGGAGATGSGGEGAGTPGADNPDGLPETSRTIYDNDYEDDDPTGVTSTPNIAIGEWGAAMGHGPSGGWRFHPDPIGDPGAENENSAGWAWGLQAADYFPVDAYDIVTVSYMFNVSDALLQEIVVAGAFWAHDQKAIDFKYHDPDAPYGEGNRNTIHFGENEGQVRFSHVDGGGGTRIYFGPDWMTLADEWVWICHVIDMRADAADGRYIATYMKREGEPGVTRIGIRYESGEPPLQTYNGRGIWGFLSPFHGYWDDMVGGDDLTHEQADMHLSVDRLRVMGGWPDDANGPPF